MMESRIKTLRKISESRDTLDTKIQQLETRETGLREQVRFLDEMVHNLHAPAQADEEDKANCA